jgi:hypothetical protein
MGVPITSSQQVRLLQENLREVGEKRYEGIKSMIPETFRVVDSDSAREEFYDVGSLPDIPEFNGKLSTLSVAAGFHKIIEPKEFGAKVNIERKLIDDKKYAVLDNFAGKLMDSAMRTREKAGVKLFSNSFSTAYDFMTKNEEGVALCSSSHTTKSGASTANGFDNAGSSAINKVSIAATKILMKKFRDDQAERIQVSDNLGIVVPDELVDIANEVNSTPKSMDTAEGNINTQYNQYKIIPYSLLGDTSTTDWFMVDLDKQKESAIWLDRIKPEISSTVDFNTYLKEISVYMRHAYGYIDWRWVYGHNV